MWSLRFLRPSTNPFTVLLSFDFFFSQKWPQFVREPFPCNFKPFPFAIVVIQSKLVPPSKHQKCLFSFSWQEANTRYGSEKNCLKTTDVKGGLSSLVYNSYTVFAFSVQSLSLCPSVPLSTLWATECQGFVRYLANEIVVNRATSMTSNSVDPQRSHLLRWDSCWYLCCDSIKLASN